MLLLVDNYDSFTWNLVHCIGVIDPDLEIRVVRNDEESVDSLLAMNPSHIVLSPGPCTPAETGICKDLVRQAAGKIPVFGVCLGHQVIAEVHGMRVCRHDRPMHGKTSDIHHDGAGIFRGVPDPISAARYHSLIVDRSTVGDDFDVSAWTAEDDVMALRWKGGWPHGPAASMTGVQFHPESFMSHDGQNLVAAFLGQ
ncbi:MAG: aminodeoxychorismate/anthranilate synthase component II [Planctomycetes bacterium]|nr:aminodeoxychorismate/anthranilate synthase component II [Planctomycetota bacterium]MCP4839553.1 aminodeoxychorismate/anthranilate synthase component II [Planctomycetota bacterium]